MKPSLNDRRDILEDVLTKPWSNKNRIVDILDKLVDFIEKLIEKPNSLLIQQIGKYYLGQFYEN